MQGTVAQMVLCFGIPLPPSKPFTLPLPSSFTLPVLYRLWLTSLHDQCLSLKFF